MNFSPDSMDDACGDWVELKLGTVKPVLLPAEGGKAEDERDKEEALGGRDILGGATETRVHVLSCVTENV